MNKQRKMNTFTWMPPRPRTDLYSRPLPNQKLDPRTPVYWLSTDSDDLYFINESEQTLPLVVGASGGWVSGGGADGGVSGNDLSYRDVLPKEAVKIDSYCSYADADFYLCAGVVITQADGSLLHYETYPVRGGRQETILRWNTGETGKEARLFDQ
jgi:hypothetical protein